MKKFLAMILALVMALSLVACGKKDEPKTDDQNPGGVTNEVTYKIAMITDYGDITDQSFNQTTFTNMMKIGLEVAVKMAAK